MQIRGAIFDMDGTLGDTVFVSVEAIVQTVLQLTGKVYTHKEIISMFGPSEPGILQQLVPPIQWEESVDIFLDHYEAIHRERQIGVFPGIEEILVLLKEHNIRQAIVTGKSRQSAEISLKYFNLNGYFDSVETGSIDGSAKKSRIQKVLKSWDFLPEDVLYIGDAPSDVRIAKSAGLRPISVAWDSTADRSQLAQQNPYAVFEQPQDLHNWLAANLNHSPTT